MAESEIAYKNLLTYDCLPDQNRFVYDMRNFNFNVNAQLGSNLGGYVAASFGDGIARGVNLLSDRISLRGGIEFKPFENINFEPSIRYVRGVDTDNTDVELFKQTIARARLSWQVDRKLSIRVIGQFVNSTNSYDIGDVAYGVIEGKSFDIDPLVTYRLNPFTVFYVGMVNNYDNGTYSNNLTVLNPDRYSSYDTRENQRKFFFKLQYLFQT